MSARQRAGLHVGALRAEAHRAAEIGVHAALLHRAVAVEPFVDQRDHRMRGVGVELGGVRTLEPGLVARHLDRRDLHAEADAEIRDAVLARELRGQDLALDAALAEAARHEDRVVVRQRADVRRAQAFGVDVLDLHPRMVVDAGVAQRLVERLVRVGQLDVLAAHGDRHFGLRMLKLVHQTVPARQLGGTREQLQLHADQLVEPLLVQHARHLVDRVGVPDRDDADAAARW